MFKPFAASAFLLIALLAGELCAQTPGSAPFPELRSIIERQNRLIEEQAAVLEQQNRELQRLQARMAEESLATPGINSNFSAATPNAAPAVSTPAPAVASLAAPVPAAPDPPSLINPGYDNGFTLMGPLDDPIDGQPRYLMNIGSWAQLRHNFFDSRGPNLDENSIEFERLRLVFQGHLFNPGFEYFMQLDADSDSSGGSQNVDMLDYFGTYDFGKSWLGWDPGLMRVRFGRWKVGFNRAREESGTRMQFSDRSTASVLFDLDRSLGVALLGQWTPRLGKSFDWEVAVTNGIDNADLRPFRISQLDRNLGSAARINWLVTGDWGSDGHADLEFRDQPAIRLGSGFTYSRADRDGLVEFSFPRVVDTGQPIILVLPNTVTAYNQFMFAQDFNLKFRGLSVVSETYFRQFSGFSGGALPAFHDFGLWLETGYFVVPQKVQLISRYAHIKGNSSTLGQSNTSSDEVAGGVVVYFAGHRSKLTFDVTSLNGAPVNDSALSIRPGDRGYLFRTTYQCRF